jgi:hypothetical protein
MKRLVFVAVLLLLACPVFGQDPPAEEPELIVVRKTLGLSETEGMLVGVEVTMADGTLEIEGGAEGLIDAEFQVEDSFFVPDFDYEEEVEEMEAWLEIVQPQQPGEFPDTNIWELNLNSDVLAELEVNVSVGDVNLELGWMPELEAAECEVGVGDVVCDLSGAWEHSPGLIEFSIGVGNIDLVVPDNVGVRVEVASELGEVEVEGLEPDDEGGYVNSMWDESDENLEVEVNVGIGRVYIKEAVRE